MKLPAFFAAGLVLITTAATAAPWTATSTTATSITGNITVTPDSIAFAGGQSLPIKQVATDDSFMDSGDKVKATIYQVTTPADPALLNGNHLCGSTSHPASAAMIAIWRPEPLGSDVDPRSVAVYSSTAAPKSSDGAGLCGVYNYEAGTAK